MRPVLAGRVPVAVVANRAAQIRAALDWARRRGVRLVLVGAADGWRLADELARLDVPVVLGPVERLPLRRYEPVNIRYENAARLHAAGVRIAFSTGESSFHAANARNLRRHAALAVGHGLPASVALRALTQGAAEILGIDARVGSIEPDKDATLIVTDRDLFDATSRVTQAWIAGQAVDLRDRQLRLYERYRDRPSAR